LLKTHHTFKLSRQVENFLKIMHVAHPAAGFRDEKRHYRLARRMLPVEGKQEEVF